MLNNLIKYGFLPRQQTAFLLCDLQEKFRPIVSHFEEIVHNSSRLVSKIKVSQGAQKDRKHRSTRKSWDISHALSSWVLGEAVENLGCTVNSDRTESFCVGPDRHRNRQKSLRRNLPENQVQHVHSWSYKKIKRVEKPGMHRTFWYRNSCLHRTNSSGAQRKRFKRSCRCWCLFLQKCRRQAFGTWGNAMVSCDLI